MKRGYQVFPSKMNALKWIQDQEGHDPVFIQTETYTEYYCCGNALYSIRHNRRIDTYSVLKKTLKDGKYLSHYNGRTRTTTRLSATAKKIEIGEKWLKVYEEYFAVIVKRLMSLGINEDDAKDYAQEAYIKLSVLNAKNDSHFKNIWMKRCLYDYYEKVKQIKIDRKVNEIPEIICFQGSCEIQMSELLQIDSQAKIIGLIQHGYSITDISELTNKTFASISSLRNRAVKQLRTILKSEL